MVNAHGYEFSSLFKCTVGSAALRPMLNHLRLGEVYESEYNIALHLLVPFMRSFVNSSVCSFSLRGRRVQLHIASRHFQRRDTSESRTPRLLAP
jgi:hypothetical protein